MSRPLRLAAMLLLLASCGREAEPPPPPAPKPDERYEKFKPPEYGFQLDTGTFTVAANSEVYRCAFVELATEEDIDVIRFDSTMHAGSHHMNVFKLRERQENFEPGIRRCPMVDTSIYDYVYAAQTPTASAVLPDNIAIKFRAKSQFMVQMHYLNPSDAPIDAGVKINLVAVKPGTISTFAGVITATNLAIHVPPKSSATARGRCLPGRDLKLIGLASHAHKRLSEFKVFFFDGQQDTDLLYRTTDWEHPEYVYYRPPLLVQKDQGFSWECTYFNEKDTPVREGGGADDEMCIAVGYYFPADPDAGPIYCIEGQG